MANLLENDSTNQIDVLRQALIELEDAIKPYENSILVDDPVNIVQYFHYLNLLWADFHIYIIEPFGGEGASGSGAPKITTIDSGRKIFDYGFVISTSVGEDYGSYCQGKLYESIQVMVETLAKKGVKKVSFIGNSVAMRVAWMECTEYQIEVANYEATYEDLSVRTRIRAIKEKAKRLQPGQELRL